MKTIIVVLALAFGFGLVGVAMAIQSDRQAFTSVQRNASTTPGLVSRRGFPQLCFRISFFPGSSGPPAPLRQLAVVRC